MANIKKCEQSIITTKDSIKPVVETVDVQGISSAEQIEKKLNSIAQSGEILDKELKIKLEKKQLSVSENVLGIGKRKIVIENSSFGPKLSDRQSGVNITPNGTEIKDSFRYTTGQYWTTTEDDKSLIFLKEKIKGAPWGIVDYNFGNDATLTPKDQKIIFNKQVATGSIGSIKENAFVTQQWLLIKPNSPFYTLTQGVGGESNLSKGLSHASLTPIIYQADELNTNNLVFNQDSFNKAIGVKTDVNNQQSVDFLRTAELYQRSQNLSIDRTFNPVETSLKLDLTLTQQSIANQKQRTILNRSLLANDRLPQNISLTSTAIFRAGPANPNKIIPIKSPPLPDPVNLFEPAIKTEIDFFDHSFQIDLPFIEKELENYQGFIKPLISRLEIDYNFFIEKYEDVISNSNISERLLPNIYVLMSELIEGTNNINFIDHITLSDSIKFSDIISPKISSRIEKENNQIKKITGQYFEKIARSLENIYENTNNVNLQNKKKRLDELNSKFFNLAISETNTQLIKNYDDKRFLFPMYVGIEFSTDITTIMTELFRDAKYTSILQSKIINDIITDISNEESFLEATELTQQFKNNLIKEYSFESTIRRVWDISTALEEDYQIDDLLLFLGKFSTDERLSKDKRNQFLKSLYKVIFIGKLRTIIKQKMRTFEQMMSGKLAYSETIMYRVEKSEVNSDGSLGNMIQNFIFPNFNDIDVLKFIDTQVKYDKQYSYQIYAYQAVIGTKYNYSDIMSKEKYASVRVVQYPSIKLIEVPYTQMIGHVLDDPPIFPEIEIVPYKGVRDKILFLLRSNTGNYIAQPIIIQANDKDSFDKIRKAKNISEGKPIHFETDDHAGFFQIFRIDKKPNTYKDFEGSLIAAVVTDVSKLTLQSATSAAYIDDIESNKKYYYTFRIVDNHNHISNPSPVFQIEMIDQEGTIYPLVEMINMEKLPEKQKSISFKKYLKISPAFLQELLNEHKSGIEDSNSAKDIKDVFLGIKDETTWGKKFKIRIISKSTGRKLDFNINFNHINVKKIEKDDQTL